MTTPDFGRGTIKFENLGELWSGVAPFRAVVGCLRTRPLGSRPIQEDLKDAWAGAAVPLVAVISARDPGRWRTYGRLAQ